MEMYPEQFKYVEDGDCEYFEELELDILRKAKINYGKSLLTFAAEEDRLSCCKVICRRYPQILYQTDDLGRTALHVAVMRSREKIIEFLLDQDVKNGFEGNNLSMIQNLSGETALHLVARKGYHLTVKLLLDADTSNKLLRVVNNDGETALHLAVKFHHFETVKLLVEADPLFEYSADKSGNTIIFAAFHEAKEKEAAMIRRFLIQNQAAQCRLLTEKNKLTLLHNAVSKGYLGVIEDINDFWPDCFRSVNEQGQNVLHLAVRSGNIQVVKYFLDLKNIDDSIYNVKDRHGNTPLHVAVASENYDIVSSLLADPRISKNMEGKSALERLTGSNYKGWTLLHYPAQTGNINAIKEIVKIVPNCWDVVDKESRNFLHVAAMYDKINVVKYCLELTSFAENVLNGKDIHGNTPLHVATSCGNHDTVAALIQNSRVDQTIQNREGKIAQNMGPSVLFQCASKGDIDIFRSIQVDMLRMSRDEDGNSILSIAGREGHVNCCKVICERCPELLYESNKNRVSALHLASANGKRPTVKYLLIARDKMEQQGRSEKLQIDYDLLRMVSKNGLSALHFAVVNGHLLLVKLLIEVDTRKELLGITDDHQETALHYAVKTHNFEIVEMLIKADPDFEYSTNEFGNTPVSLALQEVGTDHPSLSSIVKIRRLFIQNQCEHRDENGQTLLHHATNKNDLSTTMIIIDSWPECSELVDNKGENFLHVATRHGHKKIVEYLVSSKYISDKVFNQKNNNGETPLHIAISSGNQNIALSLLYEHRVNKWIPDKHGKNVLKAIRFDYDKRRAEIFGLMDEKELKDQSDFDLLVGALITTVAFTAGITVPGGFIPDGPNRGNAILHRKPTFEVFVVSNTIALALSLFAVFTHFCMKSLDEAETVIQLKVAKICSIGSIYALMVAFIMGSFSVLSISLRLAITVSGICCCFFGCSFYSLWRMRRNRQKYRPSSD